MNKSGSREKMKIRTFPVAMNDAYVDHTLDLLKRAIVEIQNKNNSGISFEELYRNAYTLVLHKYGDRLYNGLTDTVTNHLRHNVRPYVEESLNTNMLSELIKAWNDHTTAMTMIRDILMYLDRVYIIHQKRAVDTVYNLGLRLFRDEVVNYQHINDHLKVTMLSMISSERAKEAIDWMSLKAACQMLLSLGINSRSYYEVQFESHFLRESAEYYRAAGQKFLNENSASIFVRKVNECLLEEKERADKYLDAITGSKILAVLQDELIVKHMHTVVEMENSGLVFMLNNDRIEDLKLLYELLKRVPKGSEVMMDAMSTYLRARGEALVKNGDDENPINPVQYIQNLIDLKDQFDHFLQNAFQNDKDFKNKIQGDFGHFLNLNNKSPEFLSLYVDEKLKRGTKSLNEGEADTVLDKAMVLFRFLQEKDVFERYYKQHLAKRLLYAKSSSDDAEKSMISKLKTECGAHFTSKLEGMFKDMEFSNSLMTAFRDREQHNEVELHMKVLTKVYWPTSEVKICRLPLAAESAFKNFEQFYLNKHNGRVLTLNPVLGFADVKATFYKKNPDDPTAPPKEETKILTVTTYQMCILLRFNYGEKFSYSQLKNDTEIPERELKRALMSLAMGKLTQRVLSRCGNGRDIEDGDEFSVNDNFSSKLTRIRIQMVSNKSGGEPDQERIETRKKVDGDRKHEIEAAVVRVMKARKILFHNELITEVTKQLQVRFRPDPMLIKQRIESLIEREFLKRDDNNSRRYHYVA